MQRSRQGSGRPRASPATAKPQSSRRRLSYPPLKSRSEDHIGGLFADHIYGTDDKEAGDSRKYRCIDHAQPLCAVNPKIAAEYAASGTLPDRTGTGGMVAPCSTTHEVLELVIGL